MYVNFCVKLCYVVAVNVLKWTEETIFLTLEFSCLENGVSSGKGRTAIYHIVVFLPIVSFQMFVHKLENNALFTVLWYLK